MGLSGCQTVSSNSSLPGGEVVVRDQLVVHSDFHLPKRHRLLDELVARRTDVTDLLNLPKSDEPINVYLFKDADEFRSFMQRRFPNFPNRRAFFVKNDTTLSVYAYWGDRVGEDLRHEVTHGYLHSVVPNLPLWMDEGLAEYFEVSRGRQGFNSPHVYLLANQFRRSEWEPNLNRLEEMTVPEDMTQIDYAESWLWIHFMMTSSGKSRKLLQDQLRSLRQSAKQDPIVPKLAEVVKYYNDDVVEHLRKLAEEL